MRANAFWSSIAAGQAVEIGPGLGLDLIAEGVDQRPRGRRRRLSRQPLAGDQGHDVCHGRGSGIDQMVEALALDRLFQDRGQVLAHAAQGVGADRLDPRLLQRVVDLRPLDRLRPGLAVHRIVVVGDPQRHLVGEAADAGGLRPGQLPRRMR